jgi:hypothetical protein
MDNFMDKLAQKFSAQEIIKANSQAETEELERLQLQVSEYEKILQEMRKLNYKNAELTEKLELMIGENAEKIQGMKEDEQQLVAMLRDLTDEQTRNREAEIARKTEDQLEKEQAQNVQKQTDISLITDLLEKSFHKSEDFVHKENVKVYRNVQAVVVDEIKRCVESLKEEQNELKKVLDVKLKKIMILSGISVVMALTSIVLWVLMLTGVIK